MLRSGRSFDKTLLKFCHDLRAVHTGCVLIVYLFLTCQTQQLWKDMCVVRVYIARQLKVVQMYARTCVNGPSVFC